MSEDDATEASQEEQDFSDDALDRAAEEIGESEEFTEHAEEVEAKGEETEDTEDPEGTKEAEETTEMEASEEQEEEAEVPPEPADNGERSKLGRKVKYIEDTVLGFQEQFEERMNRLDSLLASNNRRPDVDEYRAEGDPEEEFIGTKAELKKFLNDYNQDQETQRQSSQLKYEQEYVKTIKRLGSDETEEDHKDIYDEMMSHFNVKYSENPLVDAEKNYLKATRSVLKKRMATPAKKVNPLKGKKPKAPLGAGSNSETMPKKTRPMPKFDSAAQDFMNRAGITPERAAEILDGETPANLGRR